jgi:hypothetical protein
VTVATEDVWQVSATRTVLAIRVDRYGQFGLFPIAARRMPEEAHTRGRLAVFMTFTSAMSACVTTQRRHLIRTTARKLSQQDEHAVILLSPAPHMTSRGCHLTPLLGAWARATHSAITTTFPAGKRPKMSVGGGTSKAVAGELRQRHLDTVGVSFIVGWPTRHRQPSDERVGEPGVVQPHHQDRDRPNDCGGPSP